ncbi:coenzyme F390 synthetase [Caldalkalibacillus thermarum]|uniref:phenylacetate--CoA ligase family protein n=1 Tax=Caldalkalibacillus thermarum TaxID=296745 RepID=UPI00166DDCD1|nr:AMP-binding protein [Caldalkalibacillus thermarum]GGK24145.1 coenzyme F390 synthetase [Caldalkalibacillus thermarum]
MWREILGQVRHHQGWQNYYRSQGIDLAGIETEKAFKRLPVLKKSDLPRLQKEQPPFAGLAEERRVARIFVSPGPIYDPQGLAGDYWQFAPLFTKIGVGEGDIVQNTFSYHLSPAGFMFDSAARAVGAKVVPAGTGNTALQVEIMRDLQVTAYAGTPGFLLRLLKAAEEKGLWPGRELALSKAIFTAEKVTEEMDRFFQERGIKYIDAYGTADLGCVAYRLPGEEGFTLLDDVYAQICDPDSGEEVRGDMAGELVISRASDVYPLVRFGTGDVSRWVEEGRSIAGVLSRVGDSYKVKGMFVYAHQLKEAVEQLPVEYYQAVITHEHGQDQLTIKVELAAGADGSPQQLEEWAKAIQEMIRVKPQLAVVEKGSISREEKQLVDARAQESKARS